MVNDDEMMVVESIGQRRKVTRDAEQQKSPLYYSELGGCDIKRIDISC